MYVLYIYHRADGVYIHGYYFFALVSEMAILFSYVDIFYIICYCSLWAFSYNVLLLLLLLLLLDFLMLQGLHMGYISI